MAIVSGILSFFLGFYGLCRFHAGIAITARLSRSITIERLPVR
jgi:hypothetical protein